MHPCFTYCFLPSANSFCLSVMVKVSCGGGSSPLDKDKPSHHTVKILQVEAIHLKKHVCIIIIMYYKELLADYTSL